MEKGRGEVGVAGRTSRGSGSWSGRMKATSGGEGCTHGFRRRRRRRRSCRRISDTRRSFSSEDGDGRMSCVRVDGGTFIDWKALGEGSWRGRRGLIGVDLGRRRGVVMATTRRHIHVHAVAGEMRVSLNERKRTTNLKAAAAAGVSNVSQCSDEEEEDEEDVDIIMGNGSEDAEFREDWVEAGRRSDKYRYSSSRHSAKRMQRQGFTSREVDIELTKPGKEVRAVDPMTVMSIISPNRVQHQPESSNDKETSHGVSHGSTTSSQMNQNSRKTVEDSEDSMSSFCYKYITTIKNCSRINDIFDLWHDFKFEANSNRVVQSKGFGRVASYAIHRCASLAMRKGMSKIDKQRLGGEHDIVDMLDVVMKDLQSCHPIGIVRLLWSLATLGAAFSYAIEDIDRMVREKIWKAPSASEVGVGVICAKLKPHHLKDLAWSLSKFRYKNDAVMKAIMESFNEKLNDADPQMCMTLFWACAQTNTTLKLEFVEDIVKMWPIENWSLPELCTSAWSLVVLELETSSSFAILWNRIIDLSNSGEFDLHIRSTGGIRQGSDIQSIDSLKRDIRRESLDEKILLGQMYQTLFAIQMKDNRQEDGDSSLAIEGSTSDGHNLAVGELSHSFQQRLERYWASLLKRKYQRTSGFQRDVAYILGNLGYDPLIEDNKSGFAVDIVISINSSNKLAIEVDGPSHLSSNSNEPLGPTLLKKRMLEASGWHVISVPIHDWDQCPTDDSKESYMLNKLKEHLKRIVK